MATPGIRTRLLQCALCSTSSAGFAIVTHPKGALSRAMQRPRVSTRRQKRPFITRSCSATRPRLARRLLKEERTDRPSHTGAAATGTRSDMERTRSYGDGSGSGLPWSRPSRLEIRSVHIFLCATAVRIRLEIVRTAVTMLTARPIRTNTVRLAHAHSTGFSRGRSNVHHSPKSTNALSMDTPMLCALGIDSTILLNLNQGRSAG